MRDHLDGPSNRVAHRDRVLAENVLLREGRVIVTEEPPVSALRVLEAAAAAAEVDAPFERATLLRLRSMSDPTWDVWSAPRSCACCARARVRSRCSKRSITKASSFASFRNGNTSAHAPSATRTTASPWIGTSWKRSRSARELLDAGDAPDPGEDAPNFDAVVARACRRPELLLLGALLHDIGKGMATDHSDVGATIASQVARRIGLDSEGREIVTWLVRNHLLMAEIATRRDLSDASVADNLAAVCAGDAERLRLLYLLTIGDSRATGPAAWGATKGVLLRDLFVKAAAAIERGEAAAIAEDRRELPTERLGVETAAAFVARMPQAYLLAFPIDEIIEHAALLAADSANADTLHRAAAIQCRLAPDTWPSPCSP